MHLEFEQLGNKRKSRSLRKALLAILLIAGVLGSGIVYFILFVDNTSSTENEVFYIRTDDSYDQVRRNLVYLGIVKNPQTFDLVAEQMNLPNTYKAGKYKIKEGLSNVELIRKIRSGDWENTEVTLKIEMTRDQVVETIASSLQCEQSEITDALNGEGISVNGFTNEDKWSIFLPDKYYFNWATTGEKAVARFLSEYNKFWTANRISKTKKLGLTTKEVCILASIVDGEAIHVAEMPIIAGLYLNRLKKGILLQADPTVLYVVGREGRKRVLNKDLKSDHPYNTYRNIGLPPGPIFLPDKRAIDAVLSPANHNYIYMCAKPDESYYHNFTASISQHNRNAAAYRRSLDRQGVRR